MKLYMKKRWDIYWNGTDGVKQVASSLLGNSRHCLPICGMFGESLVDTLKLFAGAVMCIIMPLLFWIAPVIALFTAHKLKETK